VFALGDVHGCWTALQTLLTRIPFRSGDVMVALGDYIDRGPDSRAVLDWVIEQTARGACIPLRGNHEVMLLEAVRGSLPLSAWLQFGGRETLDSYVASGLGDLDDLPADHVRFLEQKLLPAYETATHLFVHATLVPNLTIEQQPDEALYWKRFHSLKPHDSGKIVICGHTAQKSGVPASRGFGICLDTWVYGRGWLTCMNVQTGEYWQANQSGEFREGRIPPGRQDGEVS